MINFKKKDVENKKNFEINLALIALKYPEWKDKVAHAHVSSLNFCETKKKEINLKDSKSRYLYSQNGAWQETETFWKNLDLSHSDVLYVFGIGLGYLYAFAQPWLAEKKDRYLVFIEDDARMVARLLETKRATEILMDDKVKITLMDFTSSGFEPSLKTMEHLVWYFNFLKYKITAIPYYQKERSREYDILTNVLSLAYSNHLLYLSEYIDLSRRVFKNMYLNYLNLEHSYSCKDFQNKFQGMPAIICGAGSSFDKNISKLNNLGQKALIIAGGAAISYLNNNNICPHFGAAIDPDPPYQRFFLLTCFETAYFYQTRVSNQIISLVHGARLLVEDSGGCQIEDWLKAQLNLNAELFDTNYTVSDFCTSVACLLGCNPIIFVGMDLSFTEERYYASGVSDADRTQLNKDSLIAVKDIFGKTTYTKNDWKMSAKKIGSIAKNHPHITFINATEGGIGFEGIPNLSLEATVEKYLGSNQDIDGYLHAIFATTKTLSLSKKEVIEQVIKIQKSLASCQSLCKNLNIKLAAAYENWLGKSEEEINPERGKSLFY